MPVSGVKVPTMAVKAWALRATKAVPTGAVLGITRLSRTSTRSCRLGGGCQFLRESEASMDSHAQQKPSIARHRRSHSKGNCIGTHLFRERKKADHVTQQRKLIFKERAGKNDYYYYYSVPCEDARIPPNACQAKIINN